MVSDEIPEAARRRSSEDEAARTAPEPLAYAPTIVAVDRVRRVELAPETLDQPSSGRAPGVGRYVLGAELGRGGMGTVVAAFDHETGRTVALKTVREDARGDERARRRFLREARVTAQLEHPSVVPVYDIGTLTDGSPYYAMRIVERRSLREVLDGGSPQRDWPLARLCSVFVQVCRAMGYAHARGVVHRDLKPENILLGNHGEVYVADWGIAKLRDEAEIAPASEATDPSGDATELGLLLGTPGYMAPEQMRGDAAEVDARADFFALGAILYEMLTGVRAIDASSPLALRESTLVGQPRSPRTISPACPLVLEELCLRALAKRPEDRPSSADALADEVELYLEGAKEKARRQQEAVSLATQARGHAERHASLVVEAERLAAAARLALRDVKPWEGLARKQEAWTLEDRSQQAAVEQAKALASTLQSYSQALAYDAESRVVRDGLADLYGSQLARAERARDHVGERYFEALLREYDDGRYARALSAAGRLSITTPRAPARVLAYRYREVDRVLRAVEPRPLGTTPLREVPLEPGSYLLVLESPGHRDVRYPLVSRRGEHHQASVNLYTERELGEGMCLVPGGSSVIGGDPEAFEGMARREAVTADFAIARLPVTFGEYLEFVNDLERRDPAQAELRLPRVTDASDGLAAVRDATGRWVARHEIIVEGDGRGFCPPERVRDVAVTCIDWFDAVAYARWASARAGVSLRLPTEVEYEKAARGVDERAFPWGDRFDPTFCKMRDSRPGFGQPEPVGAFAADESPYGVRDLAGGARCWVADVEGSLSAEEALRQPEPGDKQARADCGMRMSRGGAWLNSGPGCRSASRSVHFALLRFAGIGVRLARSLAPA